MNPPLGTILTINGTKVAIYAVIIVVLMIFSAFFSMSEIVYSSASQAKLMTSIEENKRGARKALWLTEHFERVLSVILIGNNLVNIAMSTLGLRIFLELFSGITTSSWIDIINTLVITLLVLTFGEILPKSNGRAHSESLALKLSGILYVVVIILTPISFPFYKMNRIAMKHVDTDQSTVNSDDLGNIIDTMEDKGQIKEDEADMLQKVLDLSEIEVKDIMTPRVDVTSISLDATITEVKKCFFENQYSRVPVYSGTIDHIVGVLFEKEFFRQIIDNPSNFSIEKTMSKPQFVVGSMHADALLELLKKQNVHLAVVLDEYGGFDGIVTMEDTLEELVGEIYDEHDETPFRIKKLGDDHYLVSGDLEIEGLFDELDYGDQPDDVDATTVGGWVQDGLERLPVIGDTVTYKIKSKVIYNELSSDDGIQYVNLTFKVISIVEHRITQLDLLITTIDNEEESK